MLVDSPPVVTCGFGVRIVPLYPPACRSLAVTFAAIRLRGPRFKPRPGKTFETRFVFYAHPMLRLWDHNIGHQSQFEAWKLTISKGRLNGCRYVGRKEETRMKSNDR